MSGPEFFQTPMGKRFYEHTMPQIADKLDKICDYLSTPKKEKYIAIVIRSKKIDYIDIREDYDITIKKLKEHTDDESSTSYVYKIEGDKLIEMCHFQTMRRENNG